MNSIESAGLDGLSIAPSSMFSESVIQRIAKSETEGRLR